jgi:hypothetical protein
MRPGKKQELAGGANGESSGPPRRRLTWANEPVLAPGESILAGWGTNWRRGWWREFGGRLFVTSQRLYFVPLSLGTSWSMPFEDIVGVAIERSRALPVIGPPPTRLLVTGADGRTARFYVADVDDAAAEVARRSTKTLVVQ